MFGKRFLMSVEGRHLEDIKALPDVVSQIDLAKLASLKQAGTRRRVRAGFAGEPRCPSATGGA